MLNKDYEKILTYIFDDRLYTEEQKAVMLCSLTISIGDEQLVNGSMSKDHNRFFIDALSKAGFFIMDTYLSIAKSCNNSTKYMFKVLETLNEAQKEKYVMLFLLFISDCHTRNEDTPDMHKVMELTLNGIGVDNATQKKIGFEMMKIL